MDPPRCCAPTNKILFVAMLHRPAPSSTPPFLYATELRPFEALRHMRSMYPSFLSCFGLLRSQVCAAFCAGSAYFGTQYGSEVREEAFPDVRTEMGRKQFGVSTELLSPDQKHVPQPWPTERVPRRVQKCVDMMRGAVVLELYIMCHRGAHLMLSGERIYRPCCKIRRPYPVCR